jgi:TfoX/Sxy family transcriptional regulator of competence genes
MASDAEFVTHVVDQFAPSCGVTAKKMFGEYGLFAAGRMFAMVCDNRLLFKPTDGGRAFIGTPVEASPYPGAKPCFLVESQLDDRDWLSELAEITTAQLPAPKPRRPRRKKSD